LSLTQELGKMGRFSKVLHIDSALLHLLINNKL
jgi:hypothetical protein